MMPSSGPENRLKERLGWWSVATNVCRDFSIRSLTIYNWKCCAFGQADQNRLGKNVAEPFGQKPVGGSYRLRWAN